MPERLRIQPIPFVGAIGEDAILGVSVATTGEAQGHRLLFDDHTLFQLAQLAESKATGIKSRFTHPDPFNDGLGKYLGRFRNFRVDQHKLVADLFISKAAHKSPAGDIGQYVMELAREDPGAFGVSVVVDLERMWPTNDGNELPATGGRPSAATGKYPVARITSLYAADIVDEPALNPEGLFEHALGAKSALDGLPIQITDADIKALFTEEEFTRLMKEGDDTDMEDNLLFKIGELENQVATLTRKLEDGVVQIGANPPRGQQLSAGPTGLEQFQGYFDWLFGAQGAKLPPPELRRSDALYRAVTGDVEMRGAFDPSHVALANANTTTLADLAVNAMNKVVLELYTNLTAYRWYEPIVAVQATDGSLQDMQWLQFGGVTNLPVVAEGASYTELSVVDTKESSAFTKYGGYVGITDKMLRNSEIDRLQAIPKALTISAIRTRSAAIASIFTVATGQGPTLAQDSKELFKSDNSHGNYTTTALSIAAWAAARIECAKQAELGSAKRQVLWPKFLLVPVDLYDSACVMFGIGAGPGGYPATPNNDVNPFAQDRPGDPRPQVITVPDWTDTTNWGYIVDPRIFPVICMAYGDNPGGNSHPAPQLYSVTDPSSGLLFTNDTLPIKIRDRWAYGVATYRGIGNRVVAGG